VLSSWLVPAAILLAFAVLVLVPVAEALLSRVARVAYACPLVRASVSVELIRPRIFGIVESTDVRSCSAYQGPVTCGKQCLPVLSLRGDGVSR
jgi:hypothetical protein